MSQSLRERREAIDRRWADLETKMAASQIERDEAWKALRKKREKLDAEWRKHEQAGALMVGMLLGLVVFIAVMELWNS